MCGHHRPIGGMLGEGGGNSTRCGSKNPPAADILCITHTKPFFKSRGKYKIRTIDKCKLIGVQSGIGSMGDFEIAV